jgi:hypothetical protein
VGAEPGSLRFTAGRGPMNRVVTGSSLSTTEATVEVPVTTVDQLLTGIPAPLLWKVDVEGFEPQVLQGATQALHNPELKAVLLEADTPALQAVMTDTGFSRYVYDPFSRQLQPLSPHPGRLQPQPALDPRPPLRAAALPHCGSRAGGENHRVRLAAALARFSSSDLTLPSFLGPGLLSALPSTDPGECP